MLATRPPNPPYRPTFLPDVSECRRCCFRLFIADSSSPPPPPWLPPQCLVGKVMFYVGRFLKKTPPIFKRSFVPVFEIGYGSLLEVAESVRIHFPCDDPYPPFFCRQSFPGRPLVLMLKRAPTPANCTTGKYVLRAITWLMRCKSLVLSPCQRKVCLVPSPDRIFTTITMVPCAPIFPSRDVLELVGGSLHSEREDARPPSSFTNATSLSPPRDSPLPSPFCLPHPHHLFVLFSPPIPPPSPHVTQNPT